MRTRYAVTVLAVLSLLLSACSSAFGSDALQVYSGRHYDLEQAFERFTAETGIEVEFLFGGDAELRERIKAEGEDTPADVFMTVDAGNLWLATQEDLLAPLESPTLAGAIPEGLRDPGNRWWGLSVRARTVMYDPRVVDPAEFDPAATYAGLADPKWRDRLCMRTAASPYQQSLVASMIDEYGAERARAIVAGWVANRVQIIDNDVRVLETIEAGGCDVGLTNHYYLARLIEENGGMTVRPYWADQGARGVHVNISGAGVLRASDKPEEARRLLEWLATDGQNAFVDGNHEYPANPSVTPEPIITGFGEFSYEPINAEAYGDLNAQAVRLMSDVGFG